jgi:arabinofuranan 3-O-arabinosyltransferase
VTTPEDINQTSAHLKPQTAKQILRKIVSPNALVIYALAAGSYIPTLMMYPQLIAADTKEYLYIDPISFLKTVAYIWSPTESLGTVTHQNIGYLFPMGPFFAIFNLMHVPVWIAQRLWTGSCLFTAGLGIRYLCTTLNLNAYSQLGSSYVYMLSPYILQYGAHLSALMLPFSGLGWMLAFTIKACKTNSLRYVGAFAIVVALISSINATSLLYVAITPLLWIIFATIRGEIKVLDAIMNAIKIGIASILVCIWWILGLLVESNYGLNILKYTETLQAVASTSTPSEALRGLGYWYFYATDSFGAILPSSIPYQTWSWLIVISFTIPALALIFSFLFKWKERSFFIMLTVIGVIASIGTYPFSHPSFLGKFLKHIMTTSKVGEALRSTDRATPMAVLGVSMLIAGFIDSLKINKAYLRRVVPGFFSLSFVALSILNQPAIFTGNILSTHLSRTSIPPYVKTAANYLNSLGTSTRTLIEPGQDFADYTYGFTNDPVIVGMTKRPIVERVQVPYGSNASVDLLEAFDLSIQNESLNPNAVAPIARLMSVGDVLVDSDIAYYRYNQPPPQYLWSKLYPPATGLSNPVTFGPSTPNLPQYNLPYLNEETLSTLHNPWPPALADFPVTNSRPIIRTESLTSPIVLDGAGQGVVDIAQTGLMQGNPTILYSGTLANLPGGIDANVPAGATLVVSDSNAKVGRRWDTLRDSIGEVETASQKTNPSDESDAPINLFPKLGTSGQTVASYLGIKSITASSYGNPVGYTPEDRPYNAFDANLDTAWLTAGFSNPIGQWLDIEFNNPVNTNVVTLYQAPVPLPDRLINKVTLIFDNKNSLTVKLGPQSLTKTGQSVNVGPRSFTSLKIVIAGIENLYSTPGVSAVGFSEIGIPVEGQNYPHTTEAIIPPSDLLNSMGNLSQNHRLLYTFNRQRVGPYPPRSSPEVNIIRQFQTVTDRTYSVTGLAHISATIPDQLIDQLIGRNLPGPLAGSQIVVRSQGRLPGDLNAESAFALDGNLSTAWEPGLGINAQLGTWIEVDTPSSVTVSNMDLSFLADKAHSIPTRITISSEQGIREININPPQNLDTPNGVFNAPVSFLPLTGRQFRLTVDAVLPEYTYDYYTHIPTTLPVGIAELGIPGLYAEPVPSQIPQTCRDDLLTISQANGTSIPVWVKVVGTTSDALSGDEIQFSQCGPDANGINLPAGTYLLTTSLAKNVGWALDQVNLDSAAGGGPEALQNGMTNPGVTQMPPGATVQILSQNETSERLKITSRGSAFWLVFGESYNKGWQATGPYLTSASPTLIDGYAMAWMIKPPAGVKTFFITLNFTPQHAIFVGIYISAVSLLICLIIAIIPKRLKRKFLKRTAFKKIDPPKNPAFGYLSYGSTQRPHVAVSALSAIASGALAYLLTDFKVTIFVFCAVLLITQIRYLRIIFAIGVTAFLVTGVTLILHSQISHHFAPGSSFPSEFGAYQKYFIYALVGLAAESLANLTRSRDVITEFDTR